MRDGGGPLSESMSDYPAHRQAETEEREGEGVGEERFER